MIKQKKYLLIAISLFLLLSCQKKDENIFSDFKHIYQIDSLNANKVNVAINYKSAFLNSHDSLLFVFCPFHSNHFMDVYNMNTLKHIASFAPRGKGPGELIMPAEFYVDHTDETIWIFDQGKRKMVNFSINEILTKDPNKPIKYASVPNDVVSFTEFCYHGNNIFSYESHQKNKNLISYFNSKGKIIDSLSIPNKTTFLKNSKKEINYSTEYLYAFHPSQNIAVISFRFADDIMGIDNSGKIKFHAKGPEMINDYQKEKEIDKRTTYRELKLDRNFIYTLYSGKKRLRTVSGKREPLFAKYLHIFNWEGIPIAKIHFPYETSSFIIDKKNQRIITYSPEIGDIVYYKFSLKNLN